MTRLQQIIAKEKANSVEQAVQVLKDLHKFDADLAVEIALLELKLTAYTPEERSRSRSGSGPAEAVRPGLTGTTTPP